MCLWEVPPASPSPLQGDASLWRVNLVSCSSTSELLQRFGLAGSSGRMFQVVSTRRTTPSRSSSQKWSGGGIRISPGEFLTLNSAEYPCGTIAERLSDGSVQWHSAAGVSFLSDTLERGSVPQRFSLSPKACAGIIRRAEKRGKNLPPLLDEALRARMGTPCKETEAQVSTAMGGYSSDGSAYTLNTVDRHSVAFSQNQRGEVRLEGL